MDRHCRFCGMEVGSASEQFLHDKTHEETLKPYPQNIGTLSTLPFILFPRVAAVMQEYADNVTSNGIAK